MQKHTFRTIAIWASIVIALIYIYPTIGWMMLSPEQREARKAAWAEEDKNFESTNLFSDMAHGIKRWAQFDRNRVINLGLDLQGGIHMVLGLDLEKADWKQLEERWPGYSRTEITQTLQDIALQTVRRRVEEFEAQEPLIQALGTSQIQVQLPGEKDIERAKNLITKTAFLTFNIVAGTEETKQVLSKIEARFPKRLLPYLKGTRAGLVVPIENIDRVREVLAEARAVPGLIPEDKKLLLSQPPNKWDPPQYELYLVDKTPIMTGEGLSMAAARPDPESAAGGWMILFGWDATSGDKFYKATSQNLQRAMAIVLDDVVVSAPVIQSAIRTSGQITGSFSREQAIDLAIALNSGAMPVPVKEDYIAVVGATLGSDAVRNGVFSALLGILLVVIVTAVYYRIPGIVADVGLILNALMLLALMAYLRATLTLPGIAGLILTIGMAVDANVLVFERMREERRNGRSLLATIELGYSKATSTVLDSNVTTLIAGLVLMQFGTGPVQGFAVALCLGIVTSVYTALVVTHAMFDFMTRRNWLSDVKMMSIIPAGTKVRFMDQRRYCFAASAAVILIGVCAFAYREIYGTSNFGVDFTTGTTMVVRLDTEQKVSVGQLREALGSQNLPDVRVQEYNDPQDKFANRFLVHVGHTDRQKEATSAPAEAAGGSQVTESASTDSESAILTKKVQEAFTPLAASADKVIMERVESVGPAVGKMLIWDAIQAIFISMFFITLYLWFRFELTFAFGAILALFHDVLITVGLFALTGRQINMAVVAAILTVIGYSLNDTIVVFDRIREELRLQRGKNLSYLQIMDLSINQTLSRTLLTSGLTLVVVVVLYFLGGEVLRDFAFALILGIVFGTYSSIYVASPLAHYLQRFKRLQKVALSEKVDTSSRRRPKREKAAPEGEATV